MYEDYDDYDEMRRMDEDEYRREAQWKRKQQLRLIAHPDCRDPDHPGCEFCMETDE
jgi:hypothetical protein